MVTRLRDLAGQASAARRIELALTSGRLHHALLFAGPEGVGKFTAAKLLVQILMCTAEGLEPGTACGQCSGCFKVTTAGHADLHLLDLANLGEAKSIGVDDVRDIMKEFQLRPIEGRGRVLIIRDAEKVTAQAQNALLKFLEEPPGAGRIILTCNKPRLLLPTVLSRAQLVPFRPVPAADVAAILIKERGLPIERAQLVAALSLGSPGRALAMDPDAAAEDRDRMADLDRALSAGAPRALASALGLAAELVQDRNKDRIADRLALLGVWLRDQILIASGASEAPASADRLGDLEDAAAQRGLAEILRRARLVDEIREEISRPENYNPQMVLEQLCVALATGASKAIVA